MNDFAKLKTRKTSRLGTPPAAAETKGNLKAPETAPETAAERPVAVEAVTPIEKISRKVDGRSARATGRTEPFATRVREGVKKDHKLLAADRDITIGQLIEDALAAYKKQHKI